jgi:hypothetical protein
MPHIIVIHHPKDNPAPNGALGEFGDGEGLSVGFDFNIQSFIAIPRELKADDEQFEEFLGAGTSWLADGASEAHVC